MFLWYIVQHTYSTYYTSHRHRVVFWDIVACLLSAMWMSNLHIRILMRFVGFGRNAVSPSHRCLQAVCVCVSICLLSFLYWLQKERKTEIKIDHEVLKIANPTTILILFNNAVIIVNQLFKSYNWKRHRQTCIKLRSLLRCDVAQNYRILHIIFLRFSQHNLKLSQHRHI